MRQSLKQEDISVTVTCEYMVDQEDLPNDWGSMSEPNKQDWVEEWVDNKPGEEWSKDVSFY